MESPIFCGQDLKAIRRSLGLTLRQMEGLTGISFGDLGKIERGQRRPRPETLRRIGEAIELAARVCPSSEEDLERAARRKELLGEVFGAQGLTSEANRCRIQAREIRELKERTFQTEAAP
jgi:transcriptional regulator with XRE-family HTH domain